MNKQQLANKIWSAANKMRSKISANEYKDYILGLIFYKFVSDKEYEYFDKDDEEIQKYNEDSTYEYKEIMIDECKKDIGYFIPYKYLFGTWLRDDVEFSVSMLQEALKKFNDNISQQHKAVYEGIFDVLASGLGNLGKDPTEQTKAIKGIMSEIKDIPTDDRQDYDVLGYIYEFLIGNFAANAGKKAGEFYTPREVAQVMSEIIADHHKDKEQIDIYDPTSGSGSLLITIGKSVEKHIKEKNKVKYYAQELIASTHNLTRMNLVMRGVIPQNIVTRCADSLDKDWPVVNPTSDIPEPLYVDAVVSNPPYSQHWNPKDKEDDPRYVQYGLAPNTKADYAFLLHELYHIKPDGIMAIVMPHGVLFRGKGPKRYDSNGMLLPDDLQEDGNGEGIIRSRLVENDNIDTIIGLPANIFFGTGIPTIVMVLKKNRNNEGVLIIDASKGFVKEGKNNKLRACDVKKITDTVRDRATIPGYSRIVSRNEIRANEYNLNIPRYVDSSEPAVKYDIYATMNGGVPESEIDELNPYWEVFPTLRGQLFSAIGDTPYSELKTADVKATVLQNEFVKKYNKQYAAAFNGFDGSLFARLIEGYKDVRDAEAHEQVAEEIFQRVADISLVDRYAVYQNLADNWNLIAGDIETLQMDTLDAARQEEEVMKVKKDKNNKEQLVFDHYEGRIIPFALLQKTLLADSLAKLDALKAEQETNESRLSEIIESMDAEEQAELLNDDNTELDKNSLKKAWTQIKQDFVDAGECKKNKSEAFALDYAFTEDSTEAKIQEIILINAQLTKLKKDVKAADTALTEETRNTLKNLTDEQIYQLLTEKWITPVCSAISGIPAVIENELIDKVITLKDKYAVTFHDINTSIAESEASLSELLGQLTGDEYSVKGLTDLMNAIKKQEDNK